MNHIYKVIFCKATGTFVAVAEFARAHGKKGSGTVGSVASSESGQAATSRYAMGLSGLTTLSAAVFLSLGLSSTAFAVDATCTGPAAINQVASGGSSDEVACGEGTVASGAGSVAIGSGATNKDTKNYDKTIASGSQSVAIGVAVNAAGSQAIAMGGGATTKAAEGDFQGTQSIAIGNDAQSKGDQSVGLGANTRASGDSSVAIGGDDLKRVILAYGQDYENLTGVTLNPTEYVSTESSGAGSVAVGVQSISSGNFSTAVGVRSFATAEAAVAMGVGSKASKKGAVALGPASSAAGQGAVAVGLNSTTNKIDAVAIGRQATANAQNGDVALGQGSTTAAIVNSGTYRINSTTNVDDKAAGRTPTSVVSVGGVGTERRITNVAAGNINATSTDAINGSQLFITSKALNESAKATQDALGGGAEINTSTGKYVAPSYTLTNNPSGSATTTSNNVGSALSTLDTAVNRTLTFTGNVLNDVDADGSQQKLGSTFNISGGATGDSSNANVKTVVTNGKVDIQLLNAPTFTGKVSAKGFDAGGEKITGVAVGEADSDAVNFGQLKNVISSSAKTSSVVAGSNTEVTSQADTTDANKTVYTVDLNTAAKNSLAKADTALQTVISNDPNLTATRNGNDIELDFSDTPTFSKVIVGSTTGDNTVLSSTADGLNVGGDKITNVAAGTATTDAVNFGQLKATKDDVASNATDIANNTQNITKNAGDISDNTTAINNVAAALNKGFNITADNIDSSVDSTDKDNIQLDQTITYTNKDSNLVATVSDNAINYDLAKNIKVDSVTADDGNGNVTKMTTAGTQVKDNQGNATNYGAEGLTFLDKDGAPITNAPSITKAGISAGNQKITNVTAGSVAAGSTDAINGDQLNTTNEAVNAAQGEVNKGINFGDGATSENYKLGDTINVKGDSNVTSVTTKEGVQLGLADEISVKQVTVGDATNSTVLTSTANGLDVGGDKITNVAAGDLTDTSKDAVNGSQLKATNDKVTKNTGDISDNATAIEDTNKALNKGFNIAADNGTTDNVKLSETVTYTNKDSNLVATVSDNAINYDLAKNIKVDSVTADDGNGNVTKMTTAGTQVKDNQGNATNYGAEGLTFLDKDGAPITNAPSITKAGISAGNQKITNVTAGSVAAGSTDAINGDQLNTTNEAVNAAQGEVNKGINFGDGATSENYKLGDTINVKGDSNVTSATTADGVQLGLADEISVKQVTVGDATNSTVLTSTANGLDVGGDKITNVADGTATKDAVNKGQLDALATAGSTKTDALGNSTASNLGGGATYDDKTGTVSAPTYQVNGTNSNNVGDAISALDQGFTLQTNGADGAAVKAGDTIDIGTAAGENNLEVVKSANTIKYSLKKNLDLGATGSVTTGNTVTNDVGVTVDDGKGNVTALTKAGTNVTDGTNTSNYGATGSTITDGTGNATNTTAQGTTVTDGTNTTSYGAEGLTFIDATTGTALAGTPSITKEGISAGNTVIKDVAAGNVAKDSTDAINGNQLFETNQAIANAQGQANKGFNIAADNGTTDNVQLGETVKYTNKDSNLVATVSDNGINYDLADEISVKSVTADDGNGNVTKLDSTGTKVKDAAGNNSSYNATGATIVDTKGNTNASTAAGNTLTDDAGNETITAADGSKVKDADGNESNYGAAGSTVTDADGNETITAANGTKTKDANGNESVYGAAGSTITDTAGNQTMTAANGMTVQDGKGNATSYGAEGLTFIDTTTGEAIAGTPSITKGGIDAGSTVIRNVASGLEGKTVEQIKAEGSSSAQWKNAATVGDLTQVQGNVTNVTNNVTNISQALGGKNENGELLIDDKGNLTQAGKDALVTYNVAGQAEFVNNSVIGAINKMNEEGIKFIHVNDETAGSDIPEQATNSIDSSAGGAYSTSIGYQAKVGNQATNGIAIGKGATVTGADSIAIGTGNVVTGTGSGAIGDPSTVTGDGSYSLGNDNTVATDNSFVIGNDVTKTAANSVNLGSKSAASTEASNSTAGTTVYNQSKINGETYDYAGGTAVGVVSVGDVDAERRIQNVAAGLISKDSTDAINGSQLYGTNKAIENLANNIDSTSGNVSKGINFGNGSAANNYQLGDTINVKGDNNVTSTTTTDGVQLGLADNISVKSVAAEKVTADDGKGNSATLTANGTSVKDAAGNTSNYGAAGSTVADKEGNKATTAANGVTVSNAKNSTVYGADGMTFVDNNGTAITKAPSVTVQGINAGNQQITNVAEGKITEGSNDAVNGGQLYNTNQAITKVANSVDDLGYKLDGVQEEANAGISSAMAMASMPQAFLPGKSMISGGIATYNGEGAVAVGMSKLSDNGRWVIKINGSADTKGNAGAAAGVGMHW